MDGGSADFAGAKYLPVHPVHNRTAIPGSLRNTVHPVHKRPHTKTMCEAFIIAVVFQQACSQNKFRSLVRPWHKNLACYYTL
jgi:hypothetical protein